ncbi:MAG: asparagine--tRNA ligase [Deltaproteobacteria bacterium]|nr:asparagine--tRNA ligase [Deltaproteobacteria bacterium]
MPEAATVSSIHLHVGQEVALSGWIYNLRGSGKVAFVLLRDGTGLVQCVASVDRLGPETFSRIRRLGQESSIEVTGTVQADPRATGGYEVRLTGVDVVQEALGYPITKKEHGPAFLFDHRHLWLRSRRQQAILRVRAAAVRALRGYLDDHDYLLLDSPILTPNACEGTSTLFGTDYYGRTAWLTQSGQLYQEAGAMAFRKTYCFGPTFRAEKSDTRRHLTEFWMVEPEIAWADLDDVMDAAEDFLVEVVARVVAEARPHLEILERDISVLERVQKPFPRVSYDEACRRLADRGIPMEPEDDFGAPQETALSDLYDRPVMVHRYPAAVKAFYMKRDPVASSRALCVDVLAPEGYGEIIGGGQREDDADALLARIREHGLPESAFGWYLDLRRYGSCPHGGWGLGIERFVAWLCGIRHIREAAPFPRTLDRLEP